MNKLTLTLAIGACAAAAIITAPAAFAQASDTGTYTQNFDSMGAAGTAAPAGWSVVSEAGTHATFAPANSSTPGVSPNFTAGALTTESTLIAGTPGSSTAKGLGGYNFSATAVTGITGDQALGTDPSGNAATILELSVTNNSGSAITDVSIAYDIDRFTTTINGNGVAAGEPNTGVEEYPGYQLFYNLTPGTNSTWVNVASLNPTIDAGTTGSVTVPNSIGITSVSDADLTLASAWAAGSTIQFAWFDDNAESPSPDQLLGLNNVVIDAVPEPSSVALGLIALGFAVVLVRRRQRA